MSDDAKYKSLFNHPRVRRDLLRGFVSKELADLLDLDTLQMMPTEFVDPRLGAQRSDMVWRVNYRKEISEGELYVVVLTEFQSTVDRYMPLGQVYRADLHEAARGKAVARPEAAAGAAGGRLQRGGAVVGPGGNGGDGRARRRGASAVPVAAALLSA